MGKWKRIVGCKSSRSARGGDNLSILYVAPAHFLRKSIITKIIDISTYHWYVYRLELFHIIGRNLKVKPKLNRDLWLPIFASDLAETRIGLVIAMLPEQFKVIDSAVSGLTSPFGLKLSLIDRLL